MMRRNLLINEYSKFKDTYPYISRFHESSRVLNKYPDRIPVICEKSKDCKMDEIDKHKYLVPVDLTCGQFIYIIRKRLKLPAEKAIFIFINGSIPPTSTSIAEIYYKNKNEDGFLYVTYTSENVFG
jgi:GABA(A) receptor-associated protein